LNFFFFFQTEADNPVNDQNPHVSNIGRMVEDMEMKLRTTLETIYFGKTKDIVNELRQASGASLLNQRQAFAANISSAVGSRG
jgi:capping protein (actin filament) muscle Z-line, beta